MARVPIPRATQTAVLLANRHACCICQAIHVQLHHIDGDASNNDPANIAVLCLPHHDQATQTAGLTKKLSPAEIVEFKRSWEEKCAADILALSRQRFTFYYGIYKNPPRILAAYASLSPEERQRAVAAVRARLVLEEPRKKEDAFYGMNAVPRDDAYTERALASIEAGEMFPSYLPACKKHPEDASYPNDFSTQEAMSAFHLYDLWCQTIVEVLAEARGITPVEDLFRIEEEDIFDSLAGRLTTFQLSIVGKGIHYPREWQEHPTGSLQARKKIDGKIYRVRMNLRTMYVFSDTAVLLLSRGRVSGLGIFQGAVVDGSETEITIAPLLIGAGGWNLSP